MNVILLSGGSGTRLWPLSNEVRSKQFLKIFKSEDHSTESMAQRMYRCIKNVDENVSITVATSQNQVPQIRSQLGEEVSVCVEPCRRDTFPAILLVCSYLVHCGAGLEEPVVICPVDPYVEEEYFQTLKKLCSQTSEGSYKLNLMGIHPDYPSEKYGYILCRDDKVVGFKEKPNKEDAEECIKNGALWNGGVFSFKLSYILDIAKKEFGFCDYESIYKNYESLPKISFDYAVVEKEQNIGVIKYSGLWKDLGSWNTITQAMTNPLGGKAVMEYCENTHAINELGIPMIVLGLKNSVVVASPDGILVSDKEKSDQLKEFVSPQRPMYERREWGEYKVLDYNIHSDGMNSITKHLIISPGKHISYQKHSHRTEMWTFTEGVGKLILDGKVVDVKRGDSVTVEVGMKHGIKAVSELHIIEVQLGDELSENDIERLDFDWSKI